MGALVPDGGAPPSPPRGGIGMAVHDDWAGARGGHRPDAGCAGSGGQLARPDAGGADGWADNEAALASIASSGFVEEGRARDYGLRHGVLVDVFYMARVRR